MKPYLLDLQDSVKPRGSIKSAKPVPLLAEPQSLPKAKPHLPPKRGKGHLCKYLLLIAIADMTIIDTMIDIDAFTGDIADIADIAIYLQNNNTIGIADITIYL